MKTRYTCTIAVQDSTLLGDLERNGLSRGEKEEEIHGVLRYGRRCVKGNTVGFEWLGDTSDLVVVIMSPAKDITCGSGGTVVVLS